MGDILMTGFPGFLGSALLPRLLQHEGNRDVVCLIQQRFASQAAERLVAIEEEHPQTRGRIRLAEGDITVSGLGLDPSLLDDVTSVWHLAAVYDLHVAADIAQRVNVEGTRNVLELSRTLPGLQRLHYVSTCYVCGVFDGTFQETDLECGQSFQNHYEQTKFEAEKLVRAAIADGLPATIYRPGIVVGDSVTGETQKFDGPYFLAHLLKMQPGVAVVPRVGDPDAVVVSMVPRDYVLDAMDALAQKEVSVGKTYALTDPNAPTAREVVETFSELLGRRVMWLPLPLSITSRVMGLPGLENLLGIPAEILDYFNYPTRFDTTQAVADLDGTGVACAPFGEYAPNLIRFFREHPEIGSAAMV